MTFPRHVYRIKERHDQEEALTMSDTIVVMNKGVIQQMGSPEDIYNEPENAFVARFIGESNIIDGIMHDDFLVEFCGKNFDCVDKGFEKNENIEVVIRPEDIKAYNEIGLKHFKITGRTGSTEYIIKTISSYLNESYEGNLLGLWKQLESIKPGVNEKDVETLFIDNKKLDGFIDAWSVGRKVCDYEVCGETCNYCSKFYQGFVEE